MIYYLPDLAAFFFLSAGFIFNLNYVTFAWRSIHKNLINFSGGFEIDETLSRLTRMGLMDDRDLNLIIFFLYNVYDATSTGCYTEDG